MKDGWYQLRTPFACGGVQVKQGRICETAPIFRRLRGQRLEDVLNRWLFAVATRLPDDPFALRLDSHAKTR